LSQVAPTLLLECKLPHFSHYDTHLNSVRKKNVNCKYQGSESDTTIASEFFC